GRERRGVGPARLTSSAAPPLAALGVPAARRYAEIAPAAPHALHMPSHIFTRVGAWPESAATNSRSVEAALKGNEPDEAAHASDYMVYAYLQMARDADARAAVAEAAKIGSSNPCRFTAPYAF